MNKIFDYVIIGGGPAGCIAANFLSKLYKVALIDIAQEKISDTSSRSFPPFITRNNRPYTPAFSGVLGGNSDLWSGKIYLISEKECQNWPIKHDDLLFYSQSLAKQLNLSHEYIYNIEVRSNKTFYHRSKRSRLKNLFDTFSIRNNPNITLFSSTTIKNFYFGKNKLEISNIVLMKNDDLINLEVKKSVIVTAGGLGSVPIIHQILSENKHLSYTKSIYPLHDHAHYSIKLLGGKYQNRLRKGYIKNNNSEFEDCLVFHKNGEMVAIQIDGGYTPAFIQRMRGLYLRTNYNLLKYTLNIFQNLNSLINLIFRTVGLSKSIPYEFFFSENLTAGKIEVLGNREIGYSLKVEYNENKIEKEILFREVLNELSSDIGNSKMSNLPPPYVGLHPSGSIPMSDSYELGGVDKKLGVYGIDNLYTVGSHVFPQNGITNPTWTIMTLAYRLVINLTNNNLTEDKN